MFRDRHFRCISNGRSHRKAKSQYSGNFSRCFHCSFDTELFSRIVLFMETAEQPIYLAERMKQRPNTIAKGNCFVRARQQSLAIDKSCARSQSIFGRCGFYSFVRPFLYFVSFSFHVRRYSMNTIHCAGDTLLLFLIFICLCGEALKCMRIHLFSIHTV